MFLSDEVVDDVIVAGADVGITTHWFSVGEIRDRIVAEEHQWFPVAIRSNREFGPAAAQHDRQRGGNEEDDEPVRVHMMAANPRQQFTAAAASGIPRNLERHGHFAALVAFPHCHIRGFEMPAKTIGVE